MQPQDVRQCNLQTIKQPEQCVQAGRPPGSDGANSDDMCGTVLSRTSDLTCAAHQTVSIGFIYELTIRSSYGSWYINSVAVHSCDCDFHSIPDSLPPPGCIDMDMSRLPCIHVWTLHPVLIPITMFISARGESLWVWMALFPDCWLWTGG